MSQQIPLLNLQQQYASIGAELEKAVIDVLRSGHYILGHHCTRLENEVAALSGCRHGIGVANGTDALHLALWSLDIGAGDEVITTPFTFAATVEAIVLRGATPVFVDIDERSFNIDPKLIEKAITKNTRAIMPVHLYGLPADMDPIMEIAREHKLRVIEDNAQAIGAMYKGRPTGSFGDVASISFYPTKNLGAAGDAGLLVSNDDAVAERIKCLRAHGSKQRYYHEELGVNSRLDEIQAVVLLTKLPHLKAWNEQRNVVAQQYARALEGCHNLITPSVTYASESAGSGAISHVWHQYTVRVTGQPGRAEVIKQLSERGIGSMCYYPVPLHLQQAFSNLGHKPGDFPITELLSDQVLSLPMYPELRADHVETVAGALKAILGSDAAIFSPTAATAPALTTI
ncbi:MAG TPA: DegT/DnrJ/EryC1/StrS family aminotransferase [Planktothrix sp.]|jgi:dTDP-4-amino-4,6-dideoxygalactose transaminase